MYYQKDNNIQIDGEVVVPGLYSLKNSEEPLNKIIQRAGGFTKHAFLNGIQIKRSDKRLVWDDLSIILIKGDSVFVPQKPGVVEIQGEVYNPGLVNFKKGRSVMTYVNSAGGLTNFASRYNISIMYPNGSVKPVKLFPRAVKEGCIIFVHKKREKESFNLGNFLNTTVSLISSVALTYVAIQSIK